MTSEPSNAIWTIPNALTFVRLGLLPLFLWLALERDELAWAYLVGFVGFATDIADGKIARASGTITKLGILLDPLADRLSLAAGVLVILFHSLAWAPLVWIVIARDVLLVVFGVTILKATGREIPPVTWLGKRSSFLVTLGLGTFILAGAVGGADNPNEIIRAMGYVVTVVGVVGYLAAAVGYVKAGLASPRQPRAS